jgi:hypothetical protein
MYVKSAFLNGDLKEEVYVHQPLGSAIPDKERKVLCLRKTLYGFAAGTEGVEYQVGLHA